MVKVYFVDSGSQDQYAALMGAGVHYALYSAYSYIAKKKAGQDMKLRQTESLLRLCRDMNDVIQDSGLFTMMFGTGSKQTYDMAFMEEWQERIVQFVLQNNLHPKVVELDCQKVLGVKEAWILREKLRKQLPKHEIINVFHFEDGKKGLDRLIEYSDYIGIGLPEWRKVKPKAHKEEIKYVTGYIKNKKPEIKIHLLGCTSLPILKENKYCTSADSSSWMFGFRHRRLSDGERWIYRRDISESVIKERAKDMKRIYERDGLHIEQSRYEKYAIESICASVALKSYIKAVGRQD